MHGKSDVQLLREYAQHADEAAFRDIVTRHADLVYSAALRQVASADLARDVAQNVFTDLARKAQSVAASLSPDSSLVGWLYRGTRFEALNLRRTEIRRALREHEAMQNSTTGDDAAVDWDTLRPALDEAMAELTDVDREALLLRFFKNQDLREVGRSLGVSDDAAQKRVSRALDKLREHLSRHGIRAAATALGIAITANAVQAAPAGLAAALATTAAGTIAKTSIVAATTKTFVMTTLQKTLIGAVLIAAIGSTLYQANELSTARKQLQLVSQQEVPLAKEVQRLTAERDEALKQVATAQREIADLQSRTAEIHKLRGEVAHLRQAAQESTPNPSTKAWKDRIYALIQKLKEMPDKQIPELQFLTDKEWANVGWDADVTTEHGVREALSKLREEAQNIFKNRLRTAIQAYADRNGGMLPDDITQLASYFDPPVKDAEAMLKRWQLLQTGKLSSDASKPLAHNIVFADTDHDSNHEISLGGGGGSRFDRIHDEVWGAITQFQHDNGNQMPSESAQLKRYIGRQIDDATLQRYMTQIVAERRTQPQK